MTYEPSQWRCCDIKAGKWSLRWSACAYRVKLFFRQKHLGFPLCWGCCGFYFAPFLQSKFTLSHTKKPWIIRKRVNDKGFTWFERLCHVSSFQKADLFLKQTASKTLDYWVSCSCRPTEAWPRQIFICLAEVPLPDHSSFLRRQTMKSLPWKPFFFFLLLSTGKSLLPVGRAWVWCGFSLPHATSP